MLSVNNEANGERIILSEGSTSLTGYTESELIRGGGGLSQIQLMEFCVIIIELNVKGLVSQRDLHVLLAILRENLSGGGGASARSS